MFKNGFETEYVAGLLTNFNIEGNFGRFEIYRETKNYMKKIDDKYNYKEKYSNKIITEVSLTELGNMLKDLENKNWTEGKFGLGIAQWTAERTSIRKITSYFIKSVFLFIYIFN
jgi:hypothetical protein